MVLARRQNAVPQRLRKRHYTERERERTVRFVELVRTVSAVCAVCCCSPRVPAVSGLCAPAPAVIASASCVKVFVFPDGMNSERNERKNEKKPFL